MEEAPATAENDQEAVADVLAAADDGDVAAAAVDAPAAAVAETAAVPAGGRERRTQKRFKVRWPVEVRRRIGEKLLAFDGYSADLSANGLRIFTDGNIPYGEVVYVRLTVQPYGASTRIFAIEAIAQVMHVAYSASAGHFELGVNLKEFKNGGAKQLAELIAHFEKTHAYSEVSVLSNPH